MIGRMLQRRLTRILFSLDKDAAGVFRLIQRYRDPPIPVAEACFVAMVEGGSGDRVFTLDGDFRFTGTAAGGWFRC